MGLKKSFKNTIREYLAEIDIPLFATVVAISLLGALNLWGIAGAGSLLFKKQLIFIAIGLAVMFALSFFNYRYLKNYSLPVLGFYFVSVFLLLLTFYSQSVRGVNSWIILGGLTFEPVELAKLMLIVLMAKYFSQRHVHINDFRHIVVAGIYFSLPFAIIFLQPDLGSSIIFLAIWLGMLMAAGINKRHLFLLISVGILVGYSAWLFALQPYQKTRITAFLDPYNDPRGSGYNIIQSKIAIGSGYFFGNGFGQGSQSNHGFLPEPHNDFAFAAFTEQFGLVGISAVMAMVLIIISRILYVGSRTISNFGKLFSIGLAVFIGSHVFISAGVNVGLLPVTGLSFPFLSYGGSHILSLMIGLGILQGIKRYG
ncbi:MAG TPA: FtsW/RodA/SpoVE family cell cycle protein [Candidatus Paceibacterota bacterium]|nr:FtsW/RodA/SpoVE family cell cycle protein [Candidatus Paceibacterota bacterium]